MWTWQETWSHFVPSAVSLSQLSWQHHIISLPTLCSWEHGSSKPSVTLNVYSDSASRSYETMCMEINLPRMKMFYFKFSLQIMLYIYFIIHTQNPLYNYICFITINFLLGNLILLNYLPQWFQECLVWSVWHVCHVWHVWHVWSVWVSVVSECIVAAAMFAYKFR